MKVYIKLNNIAVTYTTEYTKVCILAYLARQWIRERDFNPALFHNANLSVYIWEDSRY